MLGEVTERALRRGRPLFRDARKFIRRQRQNAFEARLRSGSFVLEDGTQIPRGSVLTVKTTIGRGTGFSGPVVIEGPGRVEIAEWCSIGMSFRVVTSSHNMAVENMHMACRAELGLDTYHTARGPVSVGGGAWIGDSVIILGGVEIGPGAVVGAGAVVAKDVRPYAIVAGNPAREIRRRFDDDIVEALMEIQWWTWPKDRILRNRAFFATDPAAADVATLKAAVVE